LIDLLLAARLDNPSKDSDDHVVRRRNKVLSTKVSVDLHNRFNLLAEYLFESGLSESFTPSGLLRDIIEHILTEYHDGLVAYENVQSLNDINSQRVRLSPEVKPGEHVKS
jgi:predicted DNA-binding protein